MKYKGNDYENKIKLIVKNNGGILLEKITSSKIHVKVLCKNSHEFKITPAKIVQKRWCPECRKVSFEQIESFVQNKRGTVFGHLQGLHSKLTFVCEKQHSWLAEAASIMLLGTWCPVCAGKSKIDISFFHELALKKGGKCLSESYNNQHDKLIFICANNHTWISRADHIRSNHWCPQCNFYKSEEIVRVFFEYLLNNKFPKYRDSWLVNHNGNNLELDGYCSELGIAFEHQGEQHYGKNIFNQNDKYFENIKNNDLIKKELCSIKGIKLIEIPALGTLTKFENLANLIKNELGKNNIPINVKDIPSDLTYGISKRSINELQQIANSKGGNCLSKVYINNKTHCLFECKEKHQWSAMPSNIKSGKWCPYCSGNKKWFLK